MARGMTYAEATDPDTIVTAAEARLEIRAHGLGRFCSTFVTEVDCVPGSHGAEYYAGDVLAWLGY